MRYKFSNFYVILCVGQEKLAPAAANDGEVRVYERGFCQSLHFSHRWCYFFLSKSKEVHQQAIQDKEALENDVHQLRETVRQKENEVPYVW